VKVECSEPGICSSAYFTESWYVPGSVGLYATRQVPPGVSKHLMSTLPGPSMDIPSPPIPSAQ